jgi:ribonucleoside-diphosphate reductase alpha chain
MPFESTREDIKEIYQEAWNMQLKAVAIYRDGSKMSQPLSGKSGTSETSAEKAAEPVNEKGQALLYSQADLEEAVARAVALAPARKHKMPQRREGLTIEARVGGHKIYLRTGEYTDGRLGEIFIDMHKEGATLRSLLNCFAMSVSMGLQYGVPLEDYVDKFTFTRFEPYGMVDHPNIKQATSILDYIFRVVGMEYLGKTDFVHVKPAAENLAIYRQHSDVESERLPNAGVEQMNLPLETAVLPQKAAGSRMDAGTSSDEQMRAAISETAEANQAALKTLKFRPLGEDADPLNAQLSKMMGDAPMCSTCGHVTVRNGSCYRCLNCGNSMGCS